MRSLLYLPLIAGTALAGSCPFMSGEMPKRDDAGLKETTDQTDEFMDQFKLNDEQGFLTTDWGTPIDDLTSLKAGARGPTLLEDFAFRQKMQRFDHERIPERVVHARGAGVHGVFESYGNFTNITAADFLSEEGKKTPTFVRFSTVIGERGSGDAARDVRGFSTRFYTDAGNLDIVGINLPIFFIQDAMQFPDMVHALKPQPDKQIPQAATAHDTAYDFFSQQPSTLNMLMLIMSGYSLPRSYRHMSGFGVHTIRMVTEEGDSKLIRWHWKSKQGTASLLWEEAQAINGKNPDYHRKDLWDAIENGAYPEYELGVQIMDEDQQLAFGFDVLDATKWIPEELVPITILGKMTLNANPTNYFAETESIAFQPGHVVRGIDFSEDPLLQGRLFSYLDTQVNRQGINFEQIPINRPRIPIHNNNRDGRGQQYIPTNNYAYSPNSLNNGFPKQANQTVGKGFFTAPNRRLTGPFVRELSSTFNDHWSQARMVWNSISAAEKQIVVNSLRFEVSQVQSQVVKQNFVIQLNRISHDLASRVAAALVDVIVPEPDNTFYNTNSSAHISIFNTTLPTIVGLNIGILASTTSNASMSQAAQLAKSFAAEGLFVSVIAESLQPGVNVTYSAADAHAFDGLVVAAGAEAIFTGEKSSPFYPLGRPMEILKNGYGWGKPVGAVGTARKALDVAGIQQRPGVYFANGTAEAVNSFKCGLSTFRFLDRFPLDE
ncbi:cat2, catalase [Aureobasidium pullulans]|uniref:Catalase n=1 Tax=Aureobasidium pullulans TaxID=5580 RepID=A0A4S8VKD2_AURPU|nr:cat2, catalase [Aureobasidium pullulans]THZ27495.1 cat2, catalase [Aureobasidium pullulans]